MQPPERPEPEVSILVVSYNCAADLRRCLASVREHVLGSRWEVLVRDNASLDAQEVAALADAPSVVVVAGSDNPGFGRANNELARLARAPFLLLLNPDTVLRSDTPTALRRALESDPTLGAAAPILENPDGSLQDTWAPPQGLLWEFCEGNYLQGIVRARRWRALAARGNPSLHEVGFAGGACLMVPTPLFRELGGFDPDFFLNHEDMELCDRIRARGRRIVLLPRERVTHAEGTTQRRDWSGYARNRFVSRWIYLAKRFRGASLLLARLLWWESLVLKSVVGWFLLRGNARSRLKGFRAAAREVLSR
jgi:GT2 family glycosyltransferase